MKKTPLTQGSFFLRIEIIFGYLMKNIFILSVFTLLFISCGSGSNNSAPPITGLEGDIEAIEPLNID